MAKDGGRRKGEEEMVVTARERSTVWRGRIERGVLAAISGAGAGGDTGCVMVCWLRMASTWPREAPAWRVVVDECMDRDAVVGVEDGCDDEVDELIRLNCG